MSNTLRNHDRGQRRSYTEGFSFAILSTGLSAFLGIVMTYATARAYGVEVIGLFALAFAPTGAVWVLSQVREQPAMIRQIARLNARDPLLTGTVAAVFTFS